MPSENGSTSPAAMRGRTSASLGVGAVQQQPGRVQRAGEQGSGGEVAAELLEHDRGLHQRAPAPPCSSGTGERRDADLLAQRPPERLVVPRLGRDRRPHRGAVAVPVEQEPDDRGELLLLLGARAHRTPSGSASEVGRVGRGGTPASPHAPTSARTRLIHRPSVELGGVADRAVHLQRDAGGEVRGVAGGDLGRGHRRLAEPSQRGAVHQRPGEVERDPHVGQRVLDRLVGADGAAVLRALRRRRPACRPAAARRSRAAGPRRPAWPGRRPRRRTATALSGPRTAAGWGRSRRTRSPTCRRQQVGHVGVQRVRRQRQRPRRRPSPVHLRGERGRLDPRTDGEVVAEHLEGDDQVDRRAARGRRRPRARAAR